MIDVRVHTAARDETEQMDGTAALACATERTDQCRVREQRAVADRRVYPDQVLQEDAARADREMADLGVAHLALWQPDCSARRGDLRVRIALPEPVEDRCVCELDRVPRARWSNAPAVEDHERYEGEAGSGLAQR